MKKNIFFLLTIFLTSSFAFKKAKLSPTGAKIQVKRNDDHATIISKIEHHKYSVLSFFDISNKSLLKINKNIMYLMNFFERLEEKSQEKKIGQKTIFNIMNIENVLKNNINKMYKHYKKILKIFPYHLLGKDSHSGMIDDLGTNILIIKFSINYSEEMLDELKKIKSDFLLIIDEFKKEKRRLSYKEITMITIFDYDEINISNNILDNKSDIKKIKQELVDSEIAIANQLTELKEFFDYKRENLTISVSFEKTLPTGAKEIQCVESLEGPILASDSPINSVRKLIFHQKSIIEIFENVRKYLIDINDIINHFKLDFFCIKVYLKGFLNPDEMINFLKIDPRLLDNYKKIKEQNEKILKIFPDGCDQSKVWIVRFLHRAISEIEECCEGVAALGGSMNMALKKIKENYVEKIKETKKMIEHNKENHTLNKSQLDEKIENLRQLFSYESYSIIFDKTYLLERDLFGKSDINCDKETFEIGKIHFREVDPRPFRAVEKEWGRGTIIHHVQKGVEALDDFMKNNPMKNFIKNSSNQDDHQESFVKKFNEEFDKYLKQKCIYKV